VTDFLDVYDWDIDEIDFNTLKYNLGNSFEEWCLQRIGLSAEARKTVEVLLEEAGTSDCELAAKNLSSRTGLSLSITQITDIRPLAGFTNLTTLVLSGNQIKDISPLAGLTNLTVLYLSGNQIIDVSLLAGLTKLTVLSLSDNQIADISPLAGLTNLTELSLEENQITDISPLAGLTNLYELDFAGNPIAQPVCPVSPPDVCHFQFYKGE
jgi:internalin A